MLLLVLLRLSVRVEWRDVLLIKAGSLSLLKRFPLIYFLLLLEEIDPDDEDVANFFEYLS